MQCQYMFFLAHKTLHESSNVLSPEPLRFVWILLRFLFFSILYITGATKGYHFDLTLGFSHSSRSLRSTYLGCSFNFCLFHLTAIFGASFETICCILVAGLKPAPWMFSQYMLREFSSWSADISKNLLISDFEIRAGFLNRSVTFSYYCTKHLYFQRSLANKFRGTPCASATINARNVATLKSALT